MLLPELGDEPRRDRQRRQPQSDTQKPPLAAARFAGAYEHLVGIADQHIGIRKEGFTEHGELCAMPAALEQFRAEAFFERGNLLAQRGLAQCKRIGRTAEVLHAGDGEKRAEQAEFHSKRRSDA